MEKGKLIHCKTCNAEISSTAKICPSCGAKIKKTPVVLIVIAVLLVILAIIALNGNNGPKLVDKSSTGTETAVSSSKTEFYVGETAQLNDVNVTMLGVSESFGSTYNKPKDGNVFVISEFEIENISKNEINVSSMLSFDAYCDDYACNYSLSALMEKGSKNQLDGTVAPGKKFSGVIGYEVPEDWKTLEIHFKPNVYSTKDIVFVASKE